MHKSREEGSFGVKIKSKEFKVVKKRKEKKSIIR